MAIIIHATTRVWIATRGTGETCCRVVACLNDPQGFFICHVFAGPLAYFSIRIIQTPWHVILPAFTMTHARRHIHRRCWRATGTIDKRISGCTPNMTPRVPFRSTHPCHLINRMGATVLRRRRLSMCINPHRTGRSVMYTGISLLRRLSHRRRVRYIGKTLMRRLSHRRLLRRYIGKTLMMRWSPGRCV